MMPKVFQYNPSKNSSPSTTRALKKLVKSQPLELDISAIKQQVMRHYITHKKL